MPRSTLSNIPGPSGPPVIGHALKVLRDGPDFLTAVSREYGDLVAVRLGPRTCVFVNHPDLFRDVTVGSVHSFQKGVQFDKLRDLLGNGLVTSDGDFHRRQRRLAQPAFHHARIAGYADLMAELTVARTVGWDDGGTLDISTEMIGLTLDIVSKALFSSSMATEAVAEIGRSLPVVLKGVEWRASLGIDALERLPLPANRRFNAAIERMTTAIDDVIARYREAGEDQGDLVSMLMLAADEETDERMTDIHLRDETVTMLAAGHETTAAALGWSFYLLNRYPEFERRLHEEVDEVLDGRPAAMDDLPKLTFCKAILSEVLRVYPVAWMLSRRTIEEHEMRGITLPAGTNVLISPYTMHRDPRFWDAPDDFDPDRWLGEREKKITRKAYSPFGAGIRQCIGEGFAWTEATIALATIAGTWQPKFAPGFQATPRAGTTLHPGALPVTLHRRHRAR